jgi:hypothetical protein
MSTITSTRQTKKSTIWQWLLLINLAAAFYSVGTVWLAQLNWQLWQYVGQPTFNAYHQAWFRGIWWAIFPVAGVALIGVCAQIKWRPPHVPVWAVWLALGVQLAYLAGTIFWWAPGQATLQDAVLANGTLDPYYQLLVGTNWIRVALLTMAGIVELWMAGRSRGKLLAD